MIKGRNLSKNSVYGFLPLAELTEQVNLLKQTLL